MGIFENILKKEITKIEKNDTFSNEALSNIIKQKNGKVIIEEGAENGNLSCQQMLYTIHFVGAKNNKVNKDKFEYYTKLAAHQNDSTAQFNYAKTIYDSIEELKAINRQVNDGIPPGSISKIKDKLDEAKYWYEKASANGNVSAVESLENLPKITNWINGMFYYAKGTDYYDKNEPTKAIEYYIRAAELGHTGANYNLGIIHYNTKLIAANIPKAIEYFQKGCNTDDAGSCFMYGLLLYENKKVTSEDLSKAKRLFKKALDNGYDEAINYYYYLEQEGY